jgi:hypothetical protein
MYPFFALLNAWAKSSAEIANTLLDISLASAERCMVAE